jgi:hypothetical protein
MGAAWKAHRKPTGPELADALSAADRERRNARDKNNANDLLILLHFAVNETTLLLLDDLIRRAPPSAEVTLTPLQELGLHYENEYVSAKEYIRYIRSKIGSRTDRGSNFESIMLTAQAHAELRLEETPPDKRAAGVDPLILRKYLIAHLQCRSALGFLRTERHEVEERLLSQRAQLIERMTQRETS